MEKVGVKHILPSANQIDCLALIYVTVSSNKQKFVKLKLIKTYFRSKISDKQLNSLNSKSRNC